MIGGKQGDLEGAIKVVIMIVGKMAEDRGLSKYQVSDGPALTLREIHAPHNADMRDIRPNLNQMGWGFSSIVFVRVS